MIVSGGLLGCYLVDKTYQNHCVAHVTQIDRSSEKLQVSNFKNFVENVTDVPAIST